MRRRKKLASIFVSVALLALLGVFLISMNKKGDGVASGSVCLNEVMASNKGAVMDTVGGYPDWIELHNTSDREVDISGYGLTDSFTDGPKFVFPAGTSIAANGYIVVWCSGEASTGLHAPFKLSSGEEVILFDPTGRDLDNLALTAADSGHSLARQGEDAWAAMLPTPGFENSDAGRAAFESQLNEGEDMGLYINEFMASNATTLLDAFGNYSDWIEIYNSTDSEIDVSGFGVSDTLSQPMKYRIPDGVSVPAHGFLVVFCSGNEGVKDGELHAPFGLKAYKEDVVLASGTGHILDSFSYTAQETDSSMARMPDGTGELVPCAQPTPGYPNTSAGYAEFSASHRLPLSGVYISEFGGAAAGVNTDWVELYNSTSSAVSLSGYGLSNNPKNPAKWTFPDISIDAGEYLTLYATGESARAQKKNLNLNFSISASGESLFLFDPEGRLLDKMSAGRMKGGISYGRDNADNCYYYTSPSPGGKNGQGYAGITSIPVFSVMPGIYSEAQTVAITAGEGETVRYTLDCTTPTQSSAAYSGPISISKNTVVRAAAFKDGCLTGDTVSGTYLFTSDKVNHSLPVVTLVTDPDNLWSSDKGIYAYGDKYDSSLPYGESIVTANFWENGDDWERPAAMGVFSGEGREVFSQNVGISIAGAFGRGRAQKGFNVIARSEYGSGRMNYEFFPERGYGSYKAVVLRAGAQDQNRSKIRDELAVEILKGTDVNFLYQAYQPYVLYLNGEYWGVYFMKEKRNRFFVAQHEGTENTDDMLIGKASTRVSYGTADEWKALMEYVSTHDLSNAASYDYVAERIDVNSFMDYMICELYTGNSDYANIQYYKLPNGKWKWIYYDFCWGFSNVDHQTVTLRMGNVPAASGLFNALLKNSGWKDAFCRRFAELLNTQFTPEKVTACIESLAAQVEPEIAREREKFNGKTFMGMNQPAECYGGYDSFLSQIEYLKKFAAERPAAIKADLKSALGLSDSYMKEVFG